MTKRIFSCKMECGGIGAELEMSHYLPGGHKANKRGDVDLYVDLM